MLVYKKALRERYRKFFRQNTLPVFSADAAEKTLHARRAEPFPESSRAARYQFAAAETGMVPGKTEGSTSDECPSDRRAGKRAKKWYELWIR